MPDTLKARVLDGVDATGRIVSRLMEIPLTPELMRNTEVKESLQPGNPLPTLYTAGHIARTVGMRAGTVYHLAYRKDLGLPVNAGKHHRLFTKNDMTAIASRQTLHRTLEENYVPAFKIAGEVEDIQPITVGHRLKRFPELLTKPGTKRVCGVEVRFIPVSRGEEYFLPKELYEDKERLSDWWGRVHWEFLRLGLPKKHRGCVFAGEIAERVGFPTRTINTWAKRHGIKGVMATPNSGETTLNSLLYPPQEADRLLERFNLKRIIDDHFQSLSSLAADLGIAPTTLEARIRLTPEFRQNGTFHGAPVMRLRWKQGDALYLPQGVLTSEEERLIQQLNPKERAEALEQTLIRKRGEAKIYGDWDMTMRVEKATSHLTLDEDEDVERQMRKRLMEAFLTLHRRGMDEEALQILAEIGKIADTDEYKVPLATAISEKILRLDKQHPSSAEQERQQFQKQIQKTVQALAQKDHLQILGDE